MSANVGGYLRGPWWKYNEDNETTKRCFVVAWGNVVIEPSEKYLDKRITRFTIKTGRGAGRNERHLHCVSYGDRMARVIANACERGDVIFLAGTWVEITRKNKKGNLAQVYEARVNILIPMGLIGFLLDLYSTPEARQMVNRWRDGQSDPWESDADTWESDDYE